MGIIDWDGYKKKAKRLDEEYGIRKNQKDDIAPVATTVSKKKDGLFQTSSLFEDGYQFGDISKTILGTVTDVSENLSKGVLGAGEKNIDSIALLGSYLGSAQMAQNAQDELAFSALKNFGKDKETKKQSAENVVKTNEKNREDLKTSAISFVGKDLYDEDSISKKIISEPVKEHLGIDADTDSVLGKMGAGLVQTTGDIATKKIIGAVFGADIGKIFGSLSNAGGEIEEALNQGASYEGAMASGIITAASELMGDYFFNGVTFGGQTLTDSAVQTVARAVSGKTLQTLTKWGINTVGEGVEEVVSDALSSVGKKLTYLNEKEFNEVFSSQDAWESFLGGAILGGIFEGADIAANKIKGNNYVTGLTDNEQKVFDNVYNDAVAEREKDGTKLSKAEKSKIYDSVRNNLDKGYITTDTIESILGKDVYNSEKDRRLDESYKEKERRKQAFNDDLTKYEGKQRETIKRAIEGGVLNNTNRTKEFVSLVAKLSADKDIVFDFTDNKKLSASGFAIEGRQINGYVTSEGNITINVNSAKALNSVVGHEVMHVLEGTELSDSLKNSLFEYAKSKGEYQTRLDEITKLYESVENADFEAELAADLAGDYLFTDEGFIRRLSTENMNLFEKIFNEIKYLCRVATAGSKEARELERVKKIFEDAYRENKNTATTDGVIKYSLMNDVSFEENVDSVINMTDVVALKNKEQGNFIKVMNNTPSVILENIKDSADHEVIIRFDALYLAARKGGVIEGHYHNLGKDIIKKLPQYLENPDAIVRMNNNRLNIFSAIETPRGNNGIISMELSTVKDINSQYNKYNLVVSVFSAKDNYTKNNIIKNGKKIEYKKEDLSQVNPQLYEWLAIINDKSSTDSVSQADTTVNTDYMPESEKDSLKYNMSGITSDSSENVNKKDVFGFKINEKAVVNEDLLEELSIYHPDAEVDSNGNITVYHRTSKENAEKIRNTGIMTAREDALFFSSKSEGYASDYGNTVLAFKIPSTVLQVNDIFDGEVHFDVPLKRINNQWAMNVSKYLVKEDVSENTKQKQLEIIKKVNPAPNSYNTWIRQIDDIKTLSETLEDSDWADVDEFNPDLTRGMIEDAIESGEITVYSSYPIEQGVFVSPSYMEAESYSGDGNVYEKTVKIDDIAWIDPTQGMYANTSEKFSLSSEDIAPVAHGNYNVYGKDIAYKPESAEKKTAPKNVSASADIAPIGAAVPEKKKTSLPDDFAPVSAAVPSADKKSDKPITSVKERNKAILENYKTELRNNQDMRKQSFDTYSRKIEKLQSEYDSKKDKQTKGATDLFRSIERFTRLRDNIDAQFEKRINDLQSRIDKMNSQEFKTAEQRRTKQQSMQTFMENLIGDTSTWKDKKLGIYYKTNTLRRNLRDIILDENGNRDIEKADAIYDELQGKYNHNEAELKRDAAKIKQVFADMKINKYEDKYIQMLGEFRHNPTTMLTKEEVDAYYGEHEKHIDKAKVDDAIRKARALYDSLYDRVNAVLKDQGMKEIEYRKGYFPHFTEEKQGILGKIFNWKTQKTEIPTSIAGLTEMFNPERSWQTFNKQRKSDITDYSFLKGLDMYVQGSLDWIYHIEDIQKRRAFENHIRYVHSEDGIKEKIDKINSSETLSAEEAQEQIDLVYKEAGNPLNNFISDFRTQTNTLAGKKSSMDRGMEEATNRKFYSTVTNLSNRVTANMVGGSVSSALTNFIPITQSWGQVSPVSSLRAMGETIRSTFRDDGTVEKSDFLTNRLRANENLYKTNWDKVSDAAGMLMDGIDSFTSQTVWRSKYIENISKGMSENEAVKNADQFAENVLAGRSRGNNPTIFDSKNPLIKTLTAFQLEVNNQYGYMFKDMPQDMRNESKAKLIKGYATMFLGAYAYNALYSSLTGRDAAFDPIGIIKELLKDLGIGEDDEEKEIAPVDAIMNLTDNILEEVPFIGGFLDGGRIPISSALPYGGIYEAFKGTAEDISEGNLKSLTKEWLNPVYYLALPVGGGQIRKTTQGLSMFSDDFPIAGSYTDSGKLRFTVDDTPGEKIKAGLFGQYASENARQYFDENRSPLSEKQVQELVDVDLPIQEYWEYRDGLKGLKTLNEKADYIASLDIPTEKKNILINNIADRDTPIDLTGYEKYGNFEEFDFATRYPERYAVLKEQGISVSDYKENYEETAFMYTDDFAWAANNPDKYTFSKAVTDDVTKYKKYTSDISNIKADKDSNGKSISGSRKTKVAEYINGLDIDYYAKILLYKSEYTSDDTYNYDIIDYLNSRDDLSFEETESILKQLGFTVENGNVSW